MQALAPGFHETLNASTATPEPPNSGLVVTITRQSFAPRPSTPLQERRAALAQEKRFAYGRTVHSSPLLPWLPAHAN